MTTPERMESQQCDDSEDSNAVSVEDVARVLEIGLPCESPDQLGQGESKASSSCVPRAAPPSQPIFELKTAAPLVTPQEGWRMRVKSWASGWMDKLSSPSGQRRPWAWAVVVGFGLFVGLGRYPRFVTSWHSLERMSDGREGVLA